MIGLEKEILKRRQGKKSNSNENFSVSFIANLLGKTYMAIKGKFKRKSFSIEEQWAIFKSIIPPNKQTLELLEYLFTEQN